MKAYFFFTAFLLSVCVAQAQEGHYIYLNLDIQKPLSNTSWINGASARGGRAGYRSFISERISAGLDLSWSSFDEYKPTETVQYTNGAITTDYFNYVYAYTAAASGQYNFPLGESRTFIPYVGLGLGAARLEYTQYYNIYTDSEKSWGFLARPEAGILVRLGRRKSVGAMAAVHYDFMTNKSEKYDYNNFSTAAFQVGIVLLDLY